jgi:hypothetical protein
MRIQVVFRQWEGGFRTQGFFFEVADGLRDCQFWLDAEELLPVIADGRLRHQGLSGHGLGGTFFPRADGRLVSPSPHSLLLARCAFAYLLLLAVEFAFELQDFFFETTFFEVDLHDHCASGASAGAAGHFKLLREMDGRRMARDG